MQICFFVDPFSQKILLCIRFFVDPFSLKILLLGLVWQQELKWCKNPTLAKQSIEIRVNGWRVEAPLGFLRFAPYFLGVKGQLLHQSKIGVRVRSNSFLSSFLIVGAKRNLGIQDMGSKRAPPTSDISLLRTYNHLTLLNYIWQGLKYHPISIFLSNRDTADMPRYNQNDYQNCR